MAGRYNIIKSDDRWAKLSSAQDGTISELEDMLGSHQIALMVRPTGFGKTYLMIKLAKKCGYKRVLYIYPIEIIKQSIIESYHNDENVQFALTEDEQSKNPSLPYMEFCSYDKMLEDYNNTYRFLGADKWNKLSSNEKIRLQRWWEAKATEEQNEIRKKWIQDRVSDFDLIILDEAHRVGAEGFMSYWPYIHELTREGSKKSRIHVLGATATPIRTDTKIDIEQEVFYYTHGIKRSARIGDFGLEQCWNFGIMQRPYLIRGILDKDKAKQEIMEKIRSQGVSVKGITESDAENEIDRVLDIIEPIDRVIIDGIDNVAHDTLKEHGYIRLLVFHANAKQLIENHNKINEAIAKALGSKMYGYNNINPYYILSDIEAIKAAGIKISNISVISKKDIELKQDEHTGDYTVDIIHSIDMLNMGYHVGKVTGIVTMRETGSEIVYYQQIGRCISVKDNNKPLIIDLANAAAELQERAANSQRDEVLIKLKRFIEGCDQQRYQNTAINQLYTYCGMCLDTLPISNEALEFWYFDRHAPIYYIYSISRAMGKKETLESIIRRLYTICNNKKMALTLDTDFCMKIPTIHGSVKSKLIEPQPEKFRNIQRKIKL